MKNELKKGFGVEKWDCSRHSYVPGEGVRKKSLLVICSVLSTAWNPMSASFHFIFALDYEAVLALLYGWRNWGLEKLSNFLSEAEPAHKSKGYKDVKHS